MLWGLIHRAIFWDLLRIFLLALCALTGLVLMAGIVAEATQHGLGPAQILAAIPLLVPSMLPYTLPTTTLFATCVVYGRLAADSEILAIKSAGIHIYQVMMPAIALGLLSAGATIFLYLDTIPYTHWILRSRVVSEVDDLLYGMLKKDGCIRHPKLNYTIYVKALQGRKLLDAQFLYKKDIRSSQFDFVVWAKEAELLVDMKNKQIHVHVLHGRAITSDNGANGIIDNKVISVELPPEFTTIPTKSRATDMTWDELWQKRDELHNEHAEKEQEIAAHQAAVNLGGAPPHYPEHIQQRRLQIKNIIIQLDSIDAELHMRPAFALGCLCFVLVGCPVGIWFSKSDYLSAFITCFLPIVIIYYPLMLCTINMAKSGKFPVYGIWFADGLMILAAGVLFRRLARN